jgi:hypothetical protein
LGEEAWKNAPGSKYGDYCDIDPPACFVWLFSLFADIHYASHDFISYPDIEAYCRTTQTELSIYEVSLIRRMSSWAADENKKAWEESRDK